MLASDAAGADSARTEKRHAPLFGFTQFIRPSPSAILMQHSVSGAYRWNRIHSDCNSLTTWYFIAPAFEKNC